MPKEMMIIDHPELPDSIVAGLMMIPDIRKGKSSQEIRQYERQAGRSLVQSLCTKTLGGGTVEISGGGQEKPTGSLNGTPLHVSISHTNGAVAVAISRICNVGIDLEPSGRIVSANLSKRINHPDETPITRHIPLIQLWTIKEAALKWKGTGLRISMNKVKILSQSDEKFHVDIMGSSSAQICSINHSSYWLSIAFDA